MLKQLVQSKLTTIPIMLALVIASSALNANVPPQWKVLTDKTKNCQIAIPPDWVVSQYSPSLADAPDKKASVAMHGTNLGQTLDEAKATMEQMFSPTKVIEDTKSRLWYAYKSPNTDDDSPEINWYVGIPSKGNVCGAQINIKDSSLEVTAKQIAQSLAPGK